MAIKINVDFPRKIYQGDSIDIPCVVDVDLTNYKIRCEVFDEDGSSVELATANSGGASSQIEVINASNGNFTIHVAKDETDDFVEDCGIEIEVEDGDNKVFTLYRDSFKMYKEQIDWTSPS